VRFVGCRRFRSCRRGRVQELITSAVHSISRILPLHIVPPISPAFQRVSYPLRVAAGLFVVRRDYVLRRDEVERTLEAL
jgi:hypothetical protein